MIQNLQKILQGTVQTVPCIVHSLFCLADLNCDIFEKVLNKYYDGKADDRTIRILKSLE